MSRSSGQFVTEVVRHMECDGTTHQVFYRDSPQEFVWARPCKFAGDVEVLIDPEIRAARWECPVCGADHPIEWEELS